MDSVLDRIKYIARNERTTITRIEASIGASKGVLSRAIANKTDIQLKWVQKIVENYPLYSTRWLLTGDGDMLKSGETIDEANKNKNLIPFFDDVITVGGMNSISASTDGHMPVSEFIDAGDWFRDATAAIRHYGESMNEYPSGCILALKKISNSGMIVWGKNYCIETSDFRITKRLQHGDECDTYVMAYSTNRETYPDGRLIHEPVKIPSTEINNLFLVLGCVIKEQSSGAVYIKQ